MRYGVNLTGPTNTRPIRRLLQTGAINFVEILIDNFLQVDPARLRDFLGGTPCGFHIMQSHYLTRPRSELKLLAQKLRVLGRELRPLYYSDHLAYFWLNGRRTGIAVEPSYPRDLKKITTAVSRWQDELGEKLYIENFPSYQPQAVPQAHFYRDLLDRTGAGLLFDVSNATIAERNGAAPFADWLKLLPRAPHWHIGGYTRVAPAGGLPLLVDSHDHPVSEESIANFHLARRKCAGRTLSVEWDNNISFAHWQKDLLRLGHKPRKAAA